MQVFVPRGYDYREVTVRCGNTRPDGFPYLCDACAEKHAGTNWREEAELNGERIDPLD
jgi:hypothetical protein